MSIIVNQMGGNDVTIARFGNFYSGSSYWARQYVSVNNSYFLVPNTTTTLKWRYTYGNGTCDMVMIRAEIKEDAEGYIWGFKTATAEMSIQKFTDTNDNNKKKIKWTIGSNFRTVEWQAGVHVYGFTSNGLGFYDGTKLGKGSSGVTSLIDSGASGSLSQQMIIGGLIDGTASNAKDCIHMTGDSYCIDIYEAVVNAFNNSSVNRSMAHMYAASNGTQSVEAYMFETLFRRGPVSRSVGKEQTGVTDGGATPNSTITYGVQLHDLKKVTGSGYRDLIALMCEDWPEQASADADDADELVGPDNQKYYSAFCLRDMPLPTGWTRTARPEESDPTTIKYSKGDLIFGRKPKWHLWADNINVGKYTRLTSEDILSYNYNIFHPRYPSSGNYVPNLEEWENYSTGSTAHHDPIFDMGSGGITIEFHNGVSAACPLSNLVPLYMSYGTVSDNDDRRVYLYDANANAPQIKMALGDLVDWHVSAAQQATDFNRATNPMQTFYGIMGTVNHKIWVDNDYILKPVAMAWQQTATKLSGSQYLQPLSSDTTSAEKELFQKGTVNGVDKVWDMSIVGHENDRIFREIYLNNKNHSSPTIEANALLELICESAEIDTARIPSLRCRTDWVLPIANATITGRLDPKNSSENNVTNFRCILMTPTVKCYQTDSATSRIDGYIYPLITVSGASYLTLRDVTFDFLFAVMNEQFTDEYFMKSDSYKATLEFTQFTSTSGSEALKRVSIEVELAKGCYGHTDSSASGLPPMDALNANSNGYALNSSNWNDDQYKSYLRCFSISSYNLIQLGLKNEDVSAKLRENTTVKMWIERQADLLPKYTYAGADFDFKTSMWKLQFSQKSSTLSQWLFIAESSRQLTSITDALVFTFNVWDYSTQTNKYSTADLNISSTYGISVTVYNKWYGKDEWKDQNDIICKFRVNSVANQTGITPVSGSSNWKLDINGGAALQPYPDDREEYAGMANGYTFRIYSSNTSSTNWGHNNLWVAIAREAD